MNHMRSQDPPPLTYALISVHGDPTAEIGKEGAGGQNIYVREMGLGLAQLGHQVDIFTRREHPEQEAIVQLAPRCRVIRLDAGPLEFIPRTELFEHLPAFVEAWLAFQSQGDRQYMVLHTNYWLSGWVGLQLKFRLGIPQVHTYHSIGAVKYQDDPCPPAIASVRHGVEWACLEQTDCVIATSPQEAAHLRQLLSPQGRIEIIPCGIDGDHFSHISKIAARQRLGIPQAQRVVTYVGRFDERKGIETLVRACGEVTGAFRLYLVGGSRSGGADEAEFLRIQALVQDLGLGDVTTFTGRIGQDQLPAYYASADVCVVPSHYEPFGLVAIEAMTAGTPVIASNVGGLQYTVVHEETGLLVPPRQPKTLALAIEHILHHPLRQQRYGKAAHHWAMANFSSRAVVQKVAALYQSLSFSEPVCRLLNSAADTPGLMQRIRQLLHSPHLNDREKIALGQWLQTLTQDCEEPEATIQTVA
jgi:glycosyltransferase involved in cell wall biosynthesis